MSILHIIESTATGTLAMCSLLANMQSEDNQEVSIIFSRREETPENLRPYFNEGISLIELNLKSPLSAIKLRKKINILKPKTIILHSSFAGFIGRLANLFYDIPIFYIPHCISFQRGDISFFGKIFFIALENLANIMGGQYIACSKSELASIKKYVPSCKAHLIENAVILDGNYKWKNKFREKNNETITIVTVGQVRTQKGPDLMIEIAKILNTLQKKFNLLWVGDGDKNIINQLTNYNIKVTGWKNKKEVLKIVSNSDIYLSTSKWEGLPVSIIEANLVGTPVVASDCNGNIDVIEHLNTGFLYSNISDAVKAINDLCNNPILADEISSTSKKIAQLRFDPEEYHNRIKYLISS